jgi:uncharacterized protein YeaO (DUF488 family)
MSRLSQKTEPASSWIVCGLAASPGSGARIGLWLKEIAPSDALRRRFHSDSGSWEHFKSAYYAELQEPAAQSAAGALLDRLSREPVTLLFGARDEAHNNAVALKEWLEEKAE